jgi:hypothetical protein
MKTPLFNIKQTVKKLILTTRMARIDNKNKDFSIFA